MIYTTLQTYTRKQKSVSGSEVSCAALSHSSMEHRKSLDNANLLPNVGITVIDLHLKSLNPIKPYSDLKGRHAIYVKSTQDAFQTLSKPFVKVNLAHCFARADENHVKPL